MRGLAYRERHGEEEAGDQRDCPEIDVPEHAGADQRHLLAQREVGPRQKTFSVAEAAEGIVGDRLDTAHAGLALRWASPAAVA